MKKLFSLFVAGALMLGGAFMNKAEALTHYHYNGPDGQDRNILLFTQDFAYDEGYVMGIHHTGPETKLAYLGTWHREPDGYIGVKYDILKVMEANNNVMQERYVDIEMKLLKKNSSLRVITPDAPDNSYGNVYNMGEYVWGNDKNMAYYILDKTLNRFGGNAVVSPIASSHEKLNKDALEIVTRHSQGPEGEGFWFKAKEANGNTIGNYYVETDPMAIYLRDGSYLGQIDGDSPQPIPMKQRAAAIDLGDNRARVIMYKDRTTEYYDIFFTPNYFIVEKAFADDPDVTKELQAEVGVRQEYGPNPRVNEVRETLHCDR